LSTSLGNWWRAWGLLASILLLAVIAQPVLAADPRSTRRSRAAVQRVTPVLKAELRKKGLRLALRGGQSRFKAHLFPFRMTAENMDKHKDSNHIEFWNDLRTGYDKFEVKRGPPRIKVRKKRYSFGRSGR
jgi:hypothetical protein